MSISSGSLLSSGLLQGFRNLGTRIQAVHYRPVMEAFCACAGRMAAADGRLKPAEVAGFRRFVLENQSNPVLGSFPVEELAAKFQEYAVKVFLGEEEAFVRVLNPIAPGSEAARMIVAGCLAVAHADGVCDNQEQQHLEQLAQRLGVPMAEWAAGVVDVDVTPPPTSPPLSLPRPSRLGSVLQSAPPSPSPPSPPPSPSPPSPSPPSPPPAPCSFCQGKGCVFCRHTGLQQEQPVI
ncbi:MAG: tellurite resistance TerB family protein [Magnetococcales bacterium]|nr:tellurite resistance TerB family protein [Magnetococcales bacterium]